MQPDHAPSGKPGPRRGGTREAAKTFADALRAVPNDKFMAPEFQDNHVHRGAPSPSVAEDMARNRRKPSTTVFLEGSDYGTLIDEVRGYNRSVEKKKSATGHRGDNPTFTTSGQFNYVSAFPVDDNNRAGPYKAGVPRCGRITFAMRKIGITVEWQGAEHDIYAISHLELMEDVKHPNIDWALHEPTDDQSDEESSDESDKETC